MNVAPLPPAVPIPANEAGRLAALGRYGILDTPAEAEYDDFTKLAAHLCGTPVAQITLVDTERQWFKSNFGVDVPQVPREIGFCAHTILGSEVFEIPNMLADVRFRENPFVSGAPDVRFYAGTPLVSSDGFNVGALCVLDLAPRTLTLEQREALAALGRQVMRLMESRLAGDKERALNAGLRASQARNAELNQRLERLVADRTAALDASEERFHQLAEQSSEAFWFVGLNPARVLYVSPAMSTICGRAAAWFSGEPAGWLRMVHQSDARAVGEVWSAALAGAGAPFDIECRVVRPDDTVRTVTITGTPIEDEHGTIVRIGGMMKDITDARELQTQLLQAQKIEGIGQLAGGIAHDFNNLLTVINGTAELAADDCRDDPSVLADLQEIGRAGARAATLTRQLLAFSRKQVLQPTVCSLNAIVSGMMSMLERLIGANIVLTFAPADALASIRVDCGQIEQVVLNLVVNARDAMPAGGAITITTGNVDVAGGAELSCPPGGCVVMRVTDTGTGMDEVTRTRIFEPFFTTKDVNKGTGLGLSTVHGIVKQSGASIDVASAVGVGTTFSIYFPRVDQAVQARQSVRAPLDMRGTETVLLVEDNDALCRLSERVLRSSGYTVLMSSNGAAALSILAAHRAPLHLMIADVVMPGISVSDLSARVVASHPETRILLMSGYSDDTVTRQRVLDEGADFIAKPYTATELRLKVRAVLDAKR